MPVTDAIKPQTERRPPEKIKALNEWIKDYAAKDRRGLPRLLLRDGRRQRHAQDRTDVRRSASEQRRI